MNDDFVTYELAVKLKEKGYPIEYKFETKCWSAECKRIVVLPNIYKVLNWLRKEKKMHIMCPFYEDKGFYYYVQRIGNAARIVSSFGDSDDCFDTTEQAAIAGIEYVLDNLI